MSKSYFSFFSFYSVFHSNFTLYKSRYEQFDSFGPTIFHNISLQVKASDEYMCKPSNFHA